MNRKRASGFTLIELMITLALIAVISTLAVPGYTAFVKNNRLVSQNNEFLTFLAFARSEAVKRNAIISVCKSSDGATCDTSAAWQDGWIVFINTDNDAPAAVDAGEELLRSNAEGFNATTLVGSSGTELVNYITYDGSGRSVKNDGTAITGNFMLCDDRGASHSRGVTIGSTGRASAAEEGVLPCS